MPTRDEIITKLAKERTRLLERYQGLDPADLARACTESEAPDGQPWCANDHLAHLAMIERAFQGMIRRTVEGKSNPVGLDFKASTRDEVIARVHKGNQDNVDAHRGDSLGALIADLEAARADTLSLLESLTDEQLMQKVPGAPWNDGTVGGVLITNAHHEIQHWTWVEEGLAK